MQDNAADVLFGVQLTSTLTCAEPGVTEPPLHQREAMRRLACHIKPGCAHLYNAIEQSLLETLEKASPSLGREATYTKSSRILRLPPYLPIQFVRFAWRADSQKRCKVLKEVSFPEQLDLRNLLAPPLAKRVNAHWRALEAAAVGAPAADMAMDVDSGAAVAIGGDDDDGYSELPAAVRARDNLTGRYELFAVITHEGRTAEGGHYVAWIKDDASAADAAALGFKTPLFASATAKEAGAAAAGWLVFDDETVARVGADKIKKLHGGGDYHMAYMCFYRASKEIEQDIMDSARRSAGLDRLPGDPKAAAKADRPEAL